MNAIGFLWRIRMRCYAGQMIPAALESLCDEVSTFIIADKKHKDHQDTMNSLHKLWCLVQVRNKVGPTALNHYATEMLEDMRWGKSYAFNRARDSDKPRLQNCWFDAAQAI